MEYFKATFRNKGIHGCEVSRMENSKRSLMIYFYHLIMNNDTSPIEFEKLTPPLSETG